MPHRPPLSDLPPPAAPGAAIAVIGMACRLPGGADSPEALWQLLLQGADATCEVPPGRWDADAWHDADRHAPGKTDLRRAGFLREPIDRFDAAFFGIAPREAEAMDPQQRLVLEVAWEALERAGLAPAGLAGSAGGVFLGLYNNNYTLTGRGSPAPGLIGGWSASGGHTSIAAGRLSFTLGLHGPSLAVDTACSSSLVALHLAVRGLRAGDCRFALAGGCHLLLAPEALVASTKLGATAPDGRCKPFDAAANGFGHGEGCGIVVLKRLDDAIADGDPVLAVIRGSAVNQDGRSHSLTAPSAAAQEALVRRALADAGLDASAIGYVEAHGTGTPLGDPIEVEALVAALEPTRAAPLRLGSVKANLGHLEAAAGIAGFIKAVLCVQHGVVPPQPHFTALNPEIEAGDALEIATQAVRWEGPRVAGVSAFGFGGTNAHVVVEQAHPHPGPLPQAGEGAAVLPLSARTQPALAQLAARWAAALEGGLAWPDAVTTACAARNAFPLRATVVARDAQGAAAALRSLADGGAASAQQAGAPRIGFLFTGQGAQSAGMARVAYATQPAFRDALDALVPALDEALGEPALPLLFGDASLDATRLAQPLLLAVEIALARWWAAHGLRPVAVMGHSLGEYAAAVVAGALTAEEAIRSVAERGRAMQALPAGGGMLAVLAPAEALEPVLRQHAGRLDIAALNGPAHTVVAGPLPLLAQAQRAWEQDGLAVVPLAVSHAFHSHLLEPALPALAACAAALPVREAAIPVVSNLTGEPLPLRDAAYWVAHARSPVRFAAGLQAMVRLGCDLLVEIGPHAVLGPMAAAQTGLPVLASLRRGRADDECLAEALAAAWRAGARVDWGPLPGRRVAAPTYPFQRERHWLDLPAAPAAAPAPEPAPALPQETVASTSAVVYDFYDQLSVVAGSPTGAAAEEEAESHLTFGFLPAPVPGFSWVRALFEKAENPAAWDLLRASQLELKRNLFDGISFARIRRVMDYGCGHAADLCALAQAHPHLQAQGYTLSAQQVAVGRARAQRLGLADRVRLDRADSSRVPFPGRFDLVFGFEVTGLIEDKRALFDNIAAHLEPGGLLVIADFVAPGEDMIAAPHTNSYTPTVHEWVDLFSTHGLRLVRAVDASADVADWLVDPDFERNVDALVARFGLSELTRRHLLSNQNIGRALRKDLMRYLLLTAQSAPHETQDSLRAANGAALRGAVAYRTLAAGRADAAWKRWIAQLRWLPQPPARALPAPSAVARQLAAELAQERAALQGLRASGQALDRLALDATAAAFRALGCHTLDEAAQVAVVPAHARLRERLVGMLRAAGRTSLAADMPDAAAVARDHPGVAAELRLLARCAPRLADALRGAVDPLDLLFPGGDASDAEALYDASPFSAAVQRLAAAAVRALPREAGLSVLEIGGGTGATTRHLLDALPPGSSYCFTDLGGSLVARAQRLFDGRGLAFATLDIARPPASQGFAGAAYDLVVAANVLHATADLAQAVRHAAEPLRPGGWLLLVENTGPLRWGELTFGLTPGMWAFQDGRQHALVDLAHWQALLRAEGFDEVAVLAPGEDDAGEVSRQAVILARRRPVRHACVAGGPDGEAEALAQALRARGWSAAVGAAGAGCTDRIWIAPQPAATVSPDASLDLAAAALREVQALARLPEPPRLAVVSRGALGDAPDPAAAGVAGLLRSVAGELPELRPRLVDLPLQGSEAVRDALLDELDTGREPEVALRPGLRLVPQLQPVLPVPRPAPRLRPEASYLVTGAFGGVGRRLVDWMAAAGARRLVLAGRSAPDAGAQAWLERLRADGLQCWVVQADVGAPGAAQELVEAAQSLGPLRGVLHAAGVVADGAAGALDAARLAVPFQAKVRGAWALHAATQALPLDHFVLFSSAAALLGPRGQANHAAANAAMDALAHWRRAQGLPALSIDWGAWAEAGAAVREGIADRVQQSGLLHMAPEAALAALGWAMAGEDAQLTIADADWAGYARRYPPAAVPAMVRALAGDGLRAGAPAAAASDAPAPQPAHQRADRAPAAPDLRAELAALPPLRRADALRDALRSMAAGIMRLPAAQLQPDHLPLRDLGLDSLMSIELRNLLATRLGRKLPATLLFEHPSVAALAQALAADALSDLVAPTPAAPTAPAGDGDLAGLNADALEALLAQELGGAQP